MRPGQSRCTQPGDVSHQDWRFPAVSRVRQRGLRHSIWLNLIAEAHSQTDSNRGCMADVVLFHSILGLRQAEQEIAAALEGDGHRVIVPDLYDGARTDDYDEGFRLHDKIGEDTLVERARAALAEASEEAVLAGVSFGAF